MSSGQLLAAVDCKYFANVITSGSQGQTGISKLDFYISTLQIIIPDFLHRSSR